ncbi:MULTISPECIES: hypothetical protein [unclassified Streptomyces]|nr:MULTISPECIES: hypothetical protein [unclassified Streptomyces]MCX5048850.1 hypothetical protein [Streptomyces sp. NBC_00474]
MNATHDMRKAEVIAPGSGGTAQQNAHAEDVGEGELPNHDS